ncbi:MAG TPA: hypothetical protein PKD24_11005 [Pyrinomonadaceae bacterium]|nr:hypothetical protein [Pyrinomonadaceae bacterium]HMP65455.1 hypothetical protein [Pyrinomonadaceae bacterium]
MKTIAGLIDNDFDFPLVGSRDPEVQLLLEAVHSNSAERPTTYEDEVFNYLVENRSSLGIESVSRFKNLLLDGEIVLADHRRMVVEVKLRMNWLKACQAEWQFRQFIKRRRYEGPSQLSGGVVFFESFTSDWARPVGGKVRGWKHWYLYHSEVEGLRVHLLQYKDSGVQGVPK